MNFLRQTLRTLRRAPGFSLVVIVTLAVGICANTVVFSVVDGTILNPFPFPEPKRLVGVGNVFPRLDQELGFWEVLSPAEYQDIAQESRTLEKIVSWDMGNRQIAGTTTPTNVFTAFWWGDALATLGVEPAAGRGFLPEETENGEAVAILSHRIWESRFGADPAVVGSTILVNDNPYTVVGIMPAGTLIYGTDLWIPMTIRPEAYARGRRQFQVMARLADGVTLEQANAELEGIARRVEAAYGAELPEYAGWKLVAATWTDINVRTLRPAAFVLMGAVVLLLLLVCANLANLSLARALKRRREFAVKAALGAGGRRILGQLLTESTLLALLGGVAGAVLSIFGLQALLRAVQLTGLPLPAEPTLNERVLLFTAGVSLLSGILFGLAPAVQAVRSSLSGTLQSEGRGATGGLRRQRLQRVFVGVETAVALALLVGSGLLVNSFLRLQRVDPGFDTENALTMRLTLPWEKYDEEGIMVFFQQLREQVEALPGARAAAVANQFPPQVFMDRQISVEGVEYTSEESLPSPYLTLVSPGYFDAMGMDLMAGRGLDATDRPGAPLAAVVNETAARRYFGTENPVGMRFHTGSGENAGPWAEVVGVVSDSHNRGLDVRPQPEIFGSAFQIPGGNQFFLIVRTAQDPGSLLPAVRGIVESMDPDQPIYAVRTLEGIFSASLASRRMATTALGLFAAFALLLAAVGLYSVVAFGVAERTREIGLRMAVGADGGAVRGLVIRQALLPVAAGAVVGLGMAFGLHGFVQALLFEVRGTDPVTYAAGAVLLLGVGYLAAWLPARRASRLDPVAALREE